MKRIKNWLYRIALRYVIQTIEDKRNYLTPGYLKSLGWAENNGYYTEPNIKDRDRISISFEQHYYRVWHGANRTFIALETSLEWFEVYYLMAHPDNRDNFLDPPAKIFKSDMKILKVKLP